MADFITIHTNAGLAALSAAEASGAPINLTHMAVGDGAGNPVVPDAAQTALVREKYRATINRVYQSPDNPRRFTAELVVPASEGGFVMREVGVFNAAGTLFAVGNLPETYKPTETDGAFADSIVRLTFMVSNAETVEIIVDPNVAVVTMEWVENNITAEMVIPGGTTHQVLRKKSNADGDTEWADATDANVVVVTIEETQVLAASQVEVELAEVTTYGLALYVDGVRLREDEWTADPLDNTKLELAGSYPAGSKLIAVQNEPNGAVPAPLQQSLNLGDVPDKAAARTNLGVASAAELEMICRKAGDIFFHAGSTPPVGALVMNGGAYSRALYSKLFAKIGTTFGAGDGVSTFNVPDARGEFIRGLDLGRGVDPGRTLGSAQGDAIRNITGTFDANTNDGNTWKTGAFQRQSSNGTGADGKSGGGVVSFDASRVVPTANENRPRNLAFLPCIQYA